MEEEFSLVKVAIFPSTDIEIRKRLESGVFSFEKGSNVDTMRNFWGENISIHAIVGKNGSGKSTLFDIILMLINNFSYYVLKDTWNNPNTLPLKFVQGLCAYMVFRIGKTEGKIDCHNDHIKFEFGEKKYAWEFQENDLSSDSMKGYRLMNHKLNDAEILEITETFFYTIVINYSPHAYLEANYQKQFQKPWTNRAWIASLFHKNDGYKAPLTITPYRDRGVLDMQRENYLNRARLAALLIYYSKMGASFISDYKLNRIDYVIDAHRLFNKFDIKKFVRDPEEYEIVKNDFDQQAALILDTFKSILGNVNSIANDILVNMDVSWSDEDDNILILAYLYLVYKVISAAGTYPSLKEYSALGNDLMNVFNGYGQSSDKLKAWERKDTKGLCDLLKDDSHITLKIRQTINFIRLWKKLDETEKKKLVESAFAYEEYACHITETYYMDKLDTIMETLPPPFFSPTIFMDIVKKDTKENDTPIDLSLISAGQLQYVHTMSNIVYHIENLLSIKEENRVKYHCVNIMMDETELCYHPEYQRTFVYELVNTIKRLKLNEKCGINIIMSTHSPFVLSDIPQSNVLYIDEGKNVSKERGINTFAANVNELLNRSFFLSNGFMGEFAKEKIVSLINYLKNPQNDDYWTEEKAKQVIELVGDEVIRYQLKELYRKAFGNTDSYKNWILQEARRLGLNQ